MCSKDYRIKVCFSLFCQFFILQSLMAQSWTIQPSLNLAVIHDDNIRLETSDKDSETGLQIQPAFKLLRNSEKLSLSFDLGIDSRHFEDNSLNDSDDVYLRFALNNKQERGSLQVNSELSRYSSLTGELQDTGLLTANQERESFMFTPAYLFVLDQTKQIQLAYRYQNIDYQTGGGSLVGYVNQGIDSSYIYQVGPKHSYDINLNVYNYQTDNNQIEADTVSMLIGTNYSFTETLTGRFSVGSRFTDNTVSSTSFDSRGTVVNFNLTKKQSKTFYVLDVNRSVAPSGLGLLNESDKLALSLNHKFSKKVSLNLVLSHIQNKSLNGFSTQTDREYTSVSPALIWRVSERANLHLSYRYARQKFDAEVEDAESNFYKIGLQYFWKPSTLIK